MKPSRSGEKDSPDFKRLRNWLVALNPLASKDRPAVVEYHAHQIRGHWLTYRYRGDNAAIEIRGRQRPRAVRVGTERGTANELRRLLRAARGKSDKRWVTAWLGVSSKTHGLIGWKPWLPCPGFEIVVRGKPAHFRADLAASHRRVSVRWLHAIMPTRADAVPRIAAALARLEAMPAAERRKRERDTLADDVVRAVRMAQRVMVHDSKILHGIGLARFGRDINERFHGDFIF